MNIFFTVLTIISICAWVVCGCLAVVNIYRACNKSHNKDSWLERYGDIWMWIALMFMCKDIVRLCFENSGL